MSDVVVVSHHVKHQRVCKSSHNEPGSRQVGEDLFETYRHPPSSRLAVSLSLSFPPLSCVYNERFQAELLDKRRVCIPEHLACGNLESDQNKRQAKTRKKKTPAVIVVHGKTPR